MAVGIVGVLLFHQVGEDVFKRLRGDAQFTSEGVVERSDQKDHQPHKCGKKAAEIQVIKDLHVEHPD